MFLDKETHDLTIQKRAVLILSPAFYWFTKEKLDLPLSQAKKIAPSIFEGIVPPGEYSYFVEKVGDAYWFFAYNDQAILEKLSSLGIKPSQIAKVYPAQIALQKIQHPVRVGNKVAINDNGTIILLPKSLAPSEAKDLTDDNLSLPKRALPLKAYSSSFVSEDLLYKFAIVLFLAILTYAVEIFLQKRDLGALYAKEESLRQKYHLPPTSLQLRSIIASLQKIQKEQLTLRDTIDYILRTPLQPNEYFTKLDFAKYIIFTLTLSHPKRAETLKNYFIKKLRVLEMSVDGKTLFVKCSR